MARWPLWMIAVVACDGSGAGPARDAPADEPGRKPGDAPDREPTRDCCTSDAPEGDAPAGGGGGEPAELAGITLAHNQIRAMVETSSALPPLVWSPALAATAAAYLEGCVDENGDGLVDHNDDRSVGHPFYVGENIYASTGAATGAAAVASWASERAHYHAGDNTCDGGEVCGHYTQVVWRATQQLGCALHRCAGLRFPSTIVCDYGPGGNIGGQKPY